MSDIASAFTELFAGFTGKTLLTAAVTLLICLVVVRLLGKLLGRLLSRTKLDARIQKYILAGAKLLLYIVTVLIVAESLHIPMTSLVALLSVGSLGITLAAEDILGNVAGGLVILSSHPFSIGDYVEVGGVAGTVHEISLNHTKLVTPDGSLVMLPNKELASSQMTNYTVLGRRRVVQRISASYDAPTDTVKAACFKALERTEDLLPDPAPAVYLTAYKDSAIEYTLYAWALPEHWWGAYLSLGSTCRDTFAESGVEMTYDHLNVHIVEKPDLSAETEPLSCWRTAPFFSQGQRVPHIPPQTPQAQRAGQDAHAQKEPVPVHPVSGEGADGAEHKQHRRHVPEHLPGKGLIDHQRQGQEAQGVKTRVIPPAVALLRALIHALPAVFCRISSFSISSLHAFLSTLHSE